MSRRRNPDRRQELYDSIASSSQEDVIYDEMVRLGFWPARLAIPGYGDSERRRVEELQRQVSAFRTETSRLRNAEAMLKEARKRRMVESRRKREETKTRRLQERLERARLWHQRKQTDLLYLGEGVSNGLGDVSCDLERLRRHQLPELGSPQQVAAAMALSIPQLRFLAFDRKVSRVSHYKRFSLPKKTGGVREISAPMPRLKAAQQWILENVLYKVPAHEAAHGFCQARSIVSNALPHVGAHVVINLDLKDFFPTITYPRVWGVFRSLGYSRASATLFALLCTEPQVTTVSMDGQQWHVATGPRLLPQGAPTSPALTNVLCRRLDKRLAAFARNRGLQYTRYADDLTFSSKQPLALHAAGILSVVRHILREEGFQVHPDKTRVLRRGRQQEVTGVVVNDKASIDRKTLKRFRAVLFQIERDGPQGKRWGNSDDVIAAVEGYANFVMMVDPEKGRALKARTRALVQRYGYSTQGTTAQRRSLRTTPAAPRPAALAAPTTATAPAPAPPVAAEPEATPDEGKEDKNWWKLW